MSDQYILDRNGKIKPCHDLLKWAKWFSSPLRAEFQWIEEVENYKVSTVFLGLDHGFCAEGAPILWESMVFNQDFKRRPIGEPQCVGERNDKLHQHMARCAGDVEQAEAMHKSMVEHVKNQLAERKKQNGESTNHTAKC